MPKPCTCAPLHARSSILSRLSKISWLLRVAVASACCIERVRRAGQGSCAAVAARCGSPLLLRMSWLFARCSPAPRLRARGCWQPRRPRCSTATDCAVCREAVHASEWTVESIVFVDPWLRHNPRVVLSLPLRAAGTIALNCSTIVRRRTMRL